MTETTTVEELEELRGVTRAFLAREVPAVDLRSHPEGGYRFDRAAWGAMARTLGLQGIVVPEELGGLGCGVRELAVVAEELGCALYNGPYLASAVLATSLLVDGGAAAAEVVGGLAGGDVIAAVVSGLAPSDQSPPPFRCEHDGLRAEASGTEALVIGAVEADLLVVPVVGERAVRFLGVETAAPGVRVEALESVDLLRPMATVTLERAPGRWLVDEERSTAAWRRARVAGRIALAAESVGAAARALEMTVDYVGQRVQFGRVIGSFQAVKHRCADMLVGLEGARSALYAALKAEDAPTPELERLASLAKVRATDAFFFVASEMVHLHGGIGFTWEHPAHLFYRRAKANQLSMGTAPEHYRAIFQSLLPTYQPEGIST